MKRQLVLIGLALVSGAAAAQAQTVISRQVTEEPVETVITQGPYGTVVTRRPLGDDVLTSPAPAIAPSVGTVQVRPYVTRVPSAGIPIVAEEVEDIPETVGVGTRRTTARSARVATQRSTRVRTTAVARTRTVRVAAPLDLTPAQQRTIYRTIVQREVYAPETRVIRVAPSVAPVYAAPRVAAEFEDSYAAAYPAPAYPAYQTPVYQAPVSYPATVYAPAVVPAVTYRVGSVLPQSVAIAPVPEPVAAQIPLTRGYRYVVINNRVLLVDPATGVVVADVTQ